ncbi:hypothetical protein OPIT5_00675 [Opitutaceae bacterium TAV5]|nr:hypothetical protein OPIT5_00675 [Opitutaceae bacterium TAV5]
MLEIILLYFLCKRMGQMLRSKGWSRPIWMQILVVVTWLGCMFMGALIYGVYVVITQGEDALNDIGLAAYLPALISAGIGVGIIFFIAKMLPAQTTLHEEGS